MKRTKLVAAIACALAISACMVGCSESGESTPANYNVYKSTGTGYTVTGDNTVKAGEDYTFTVSTDEGYDVSGMKVYANGKVLTANNGTYTVADASEALTIYVTGVEEVEEVVVTEYVDVTFVGENVDFNGDAQVVKGTEYSFTANAYTGYALGEVKNGSTVLTATDGVYTVTADANLAITATATKILDLKTVAGDTPSKGGNVYVGDDGKTHISITYTAEDNFMKSETEVHYHEVGFTVSDEAWANAPADANVAFVTLRIVSKGEDVSSDINPVSGAETTIWGVEDGLASLGFGSMMWPGVNIKEVPVGGRYTAPLKKGNKFVVRNVDGFEAIVESVEFRTVSAIAAEGADMGGAVNVAVDEYNDVWLRSSGGNALTLDLKKILGEDCGGKKVRIDIVRRDDVWNGTGNVQIGHSMLGGYETGYYTDTIAENGTYTFPAIDAMGSALVTLHFTIVEA